MIIEILQQWLLICSHSDWDLWGPFLICLTLGILLSVNVSASLEIHGMDYSLSTVQAPASQSLAVFTSVVAIIGVGSLVVTVQAQVSVLIHFEHSSVFTRHFIVIGW